MKTFTLRFNPIWFFRLLGIAALGLVAATAQGAVLVSYQFATPTLTDINKATTVADDATASLATWNGFSGAGTFSTATDSAYVPMQNTGSTLNTGNYLTFTLTADPGYWLDLTSLSFQLGTYYAAMPAGGTTTFAQVRSDVGGFAASLSLNPGSVTQASVTSTSPTENILNTWTLDLSGAAYQGLSAISFRLYLYDNSDVVGNYSRFKDIVLNGSVNFPTPPIPEPSSTALLFLSGIAFAVVRHRFRFVRR